MTKSLRLVLLLVIAAAVLFMVISFLDYSHRKHDLTVLEQNLSVSRKTWETIAEEKVELQAVLKTKKEELKEAELSLSEASERAKTLKAEIETLQKDIQALKESMKSED